MHKLFVDFNNSDTSGRVRLNTVGTQEDILHQAIQLQHGLELLLDDGDGLTTPGVIEFSDSEQIWVARIDWNRLKPATK